MRIAIFSDVHANLLALEAVLAGIDYQKPDGIFCLGDLVNQNVWNNEVVEIIRERKIPTLKGNHDSGIAMGKSIFPFSYTFPEARQWGIEAIAYTLKTIKKENQDFLGKMPVKIRITIPQINNKNFTILLVHSHPENQNERLYRFTPKEEFRQLLESSNADMLVTGHTHCPYDIVIKDEQDGETTYRHAINPGSVGRPKDGDWRPCYVQLTFDTSRHLLTEPDAINVDFYRVKYDLGKAVKAIKKSELSVYYGSCLITG